MLGLELVDQLLDTVQASVHATDLRLVDPGDRRNVSAVAAVDLLERVGNLADGRLGAGGLDSALEQVAGACLGVLGQRVKGLLDLGFVALGPKAGELVELLAAYSAVVHLEDGDVGVAVGPVFVHPDDGLLAAS